MRHQTAFVIAAALAFHGRALCQSSQGDRVTSRTEMSSDARPYMPQTSGTFTSTIERLRGRTRMDVVEGTQPGLTPGEYTLLDSLDFITVDPATHTFTRFSLPNGASKMNAPGGLASARIDSVETSLDSASMMDSVTGATEMRYAFRVKSASVVTMDPSRLPPGMEMPDMHVTVIQSFEFWYAPGPNDASVPPRPGAAVASPLSAKMAEGFSRLPRKQVVRSSTVTRTEGAAGNYETRTNTKLLKRETVTLDDDRFVIPAGYTEKPLTDAAPADSAWLARWMHKPQ